MSYENKKTILLVEDEVIIAMSQKMALENYGYNVIIVHSGEKAIETIKNTPDIQLILMDIDLGKGLDGTEAAACILQDHDIPVVFCSSHTEPDIVEKTEKITSYGYVVKSSSNTVLDASIKMAFKLFEANRKIVDSESKQKAMISNISDVIGIIDVNGIMKYKSPNIEKWFGWKPEDLFGTDGWLTVHPDDLERIQKEFYTLLKTDNSSIQVEYRYKCKNGSYKPIELTATNLVNNPLIKGVLLNYHDITERKFVEEKLKTSEEKYRLQFQNMNSYNSMYEVITDKDGKPYDFRFIMVNQAYENYVGKKSSDLIGKTLLEVFPATEQYWIDKMAEAVLSDKPLHFENYSREMNTYTEINLFIPQKGQLAMITANISERKQAESALQSKNEEYEALNEELQSSMEELQAASEELQVQNEELRHADEILRESEDKFKYVFDNSIVGKSLTLLTGEVNVNQALCGMLGYALAEFKNKKWQEITHPDDIELTQKEIDGLVSGLRDSTRFTKRFLHKDGSVIWVDLSSSIRRDNYGKPMYLMSSVVDITERKKAEELLRESEIRLRIILDATPFPIAIVDLQDNNINFWSRSALTLFGHTAPTAEEWYKIAYPDPDYRKDVVNRWKPFLEMAKVSGVPINTGEYQVTCRDGSVRICELYATFIDTNLIVTFNNITERKLAEEELRRNQKDLIKTQKIAHIGNWRLDIATNEVVWSEELYRMYGFDPSLPPPPYTEHQKLFTPESWELLSSSLARTRETGIPYELELKTVREDGRNGWMWVRGEAVLDENGRIVGLWGAAQDITERKLAEIKTIDLLAEKEIILKEVNHRIKNNMATVEGLLRLQAYKLTEPSAIAALENAGKRMQSMRVLYEKLYQSIDFMELPIEEYLSPLIDEILANFTESSSIKVEKNIDDFILDAKRLQPIGIIINELLTNTMKYAFTDVSRGIVTISVTLAKGLVTLAVQDNGKGIPESINFGNSTGFGLTLVHALSTQLGGKIRIERLGGTGIILEFEL